MSDWDFDVDFGLARVLGSVVVVYVYVCGSENMFVWICSIFFAKQWICYICIESMFNLHLCDMKVARAYRCCALCVQRHACMNNNDAYVFFLCNSTTVCTNLSI